MQFTFGIITSPRTRDHLKSCIDSIKSQGIDKNSFEIVIVGNSNIDDGENIKKIEFDELIKPMWITRKKNLITQNSSFNNICYLHDYVSLKEGWYEGFLKFGEAWDICMNPISNLDGARCLDWMGLPDDPVYGNVVLPYDYKGSDGMYIPGYYWVAKKKLMEDFPLNEDFVWNEGEDIEWSKRVLGGYPQRWLKNLQDFEEGKIKVSNIKYFLNPFSEVKFLKQKNFPSDFFTEYDLHSGKEARPLESNEKNYYYLKFNKIPQRV
jgi:hypothetical protein